MRTVLVHAVPVRNLRTSAVATAIDHMLPARGLTACVRTVDASVEPADGCGSVAWTNSSGASGPIGASGPSGAIGHPAAIWFVAVLALPTALSVNLGGLRLAPYRLVLIAAFVPVVTRFLRSDGPPRTWIDLAVVGSAFWGGLSLGMTGGASRGVEAGGVLVAETAGAYLLGRIAIRDASSYLRVLELLRKVLVVVALVSALESVTGRHLVHEFIAATTGFRVGTDVEGRFGFARAYGPFDHPILNGTFCGALFGIFWMLPRRGGVVGAWPAGLGAGASLSSACLIAVAVQGALIAYDTILRELKVRWRLLAVVAVLAYIGISAASNRSGMKAILWYVTLSRETAAYRLMIWEYGLENVRAHMLFGVGPGNWVRPAWMPDSVDAFWLQLSLIHGLPSSLMLLGGTLGRIRACALARTHDPERAVIRRGYVMTLAALVFVGFTVHYWNNVFVLFAFVLGAGAWIGEREARSETAGRR